MLRIGNQHRGLGAVGRAALFGQGRLQVALAGFLHIDDSDRPVHAVGKVHCRADICCLRRDHEDLRIGFLLSVAHVQHVHRQVVDMGVDHVPNLVARGRFELLRRHRGRWNLQKMVLLRTQHHRRREPLQVERLQPG